MTFSQGFLLTRHFFLILIPSIFQNARNFSLSAAKSTSGGKFPFKGAKYMFFALFFSIFCRYSDADSLPISLLSHFDCLFVPCFLLFLHFRLSVAPLSLSRALSLLLLTFYGAFYFPITTFSSLLLPPFFAVASAFYRLSLVFVRIFAFLSSIEPPARFFTCFTTSLPFEPKQKP